MNLKKLIPVLTLVVALILAASALNTPWWSIQNPISEQIKTNVTNNAYYNPSQTISANHVEPSENNNTYSVTVPFSDLGMNNTDTSSLNSTFNTTYYLAIPGIVFTLLAIAFTVVSILRKPMFAFAWIFALIGAVLLFVAPIYLVTQMPPALVNLPTVTPPEIAISPGANVTSFWGSSHSWTWGAGTGWTLMFTSAMFCGTSVILIRVQKKK